MICEKKSSENSDGKQAKLRQEFGKTESENAAN